MSTKKIQFIITTFAVSSLFLIYYKYSIQDEKFEIQNENPEEDLNAILTNIRNNYLDPGFEIPVSKKPKIKDYNEMHKDFKNIFASYLYKERTNDFGFFIECGAADGTFHSNTFFIEKKYNWDGLLIEANPNLYKKLRELKRRAWTSNICLSSIPKKMEFYEYTGPISNIGVGQIVERNSTPYPSIYFKAEDYHNIGTIECFPLHYLLMALNVTKVDFFSLDVESYEYKVLSTFPFDKIKVMILLVEYNLVPEGKPALDELMTKNGFYIKHQDAQNVFYFNKELL